MASNRYLLLLPSDRHAALSRAVPQDDWIARRLTCVFWPVKPMEPGIPNTKIVTMLRNMDNVLHTYGLMDIVFMTAECRRLVMEAAVDQADWIQLWHKAVDMTHDHQSIQVETFNTIMGRLGYEL